MRRRSVLQMFAATAGMLPIRPWQAWAQTVTFPGQQAETLERLALVVLPASLGREGILRVVSAFERWVQDYRAGADTDHGYGVTRIARLPDSPAPRYIAQLAELQSALRSDDIEQRRTAVMEALNKAAVNDLSPHPRGRHVAADLMSFYFYSSEANDLCYNAAIERFRCRGVEHSDVPPPPLHKTVKR